MTLFFISLSFLQWNLHIQYLFNQSIYRTNWFTILENQFIANLELFQTKKDLQIKHQIRKKSIYFLSLVSYSTNKLKIHMLFTSKYLVFSKFMEK